VVLVSRRPRVLLFAHRFGHPNATGVGRYVAQLAAALDECEQARFADYVVCSAPEPHPDPPPLHHVEVRRLTPPRRPLHLAWTLAGRPPVERLAGPADLVHVLDPSVPVPTHLPGVLTVHDLMPLQFPQWYPPAHRWAFGRAVRASVARGDTIVTVSEKVAGDAVSILGVAPDRVRVVYPGVAAEFLAPVTAAQQVEACRRHRVQRGGFFVCVGTVTTRKNLTPVVQALASIGTTPLLVVGPDGYGADAVRAEVQRANVGDRVQFAGYVDGAALPALVSAAIALVHPSSYEGFGFPPVEAMAVGTPAIVSAAGALPEVVGDAGILVDPEDVDAWADAMTTVRDDATRRDALSTDGTARAGSFRWDATARAIVDVHRCRLGI
jgi:glycosyltransferase involved in cell wall biosynthesis